MGRGLTFALSPRVLRVNFRLDAAKLIPASFCNRPRSIPSLASNPNDDPFVCGAARSCRAEDPAWFVTAVFFGIDALVDPAQLRCLVAAIVNQYPSSPAEPLICIDTGLLRDMGDPG